MKKVILGNTGIEVSEIGFGVLPIGGSQLDLDLDEGSDVIRYALSKGITFFDTAQYYDTYKYISPAIKNLNKGEKPVICSKCLLPGYDDMKEAVSQAMEELSVDHIDIFLLHEVTGEDDFLNRSGAWNYLKEAKSAGIISAIGVSTHHQDVCLYMAGIKECDVVFPLINKDGLGIRNGSNAGTSEGMAEAIRKCHDEGKGVFAMKVFGGGNLTGEYTECLNYVSGLKCVDAMVIGFTSSEEIDRIIQYTEGLLPEDYVPDMTRKKMFISQDDCIGCLSCKNRCTSQAIFINENGLCEIDQSKCLTCGYCSPVCPVRALIMIDLKC